MLHVGYKLECVFWNGTCSCTTKVESKITQVSPLAEPILWVSLDSIGDST